MGSRGLLDGPKFSGSHTTLTQHAEDVVAALKKMDEVTKISIGRIKPGTKSTGVKVTDEGAALKVVVKGDGASQTFHVYCTDRPTVRAMLLTTDF